MIMQRDGRGRLRPGVNPERKAPRDGNSLVLTIDIELQRVAEQELNRGVRETGAESGICVATRSVKTGDVLGHGFDTDVRSEPTGQSIQECDPQPCNHGSVRTGVDH